MKLLKKSVLSQDLNNQRKMQIDEGVYMATKVDTLRKSLNELEEQYKNFAQNKQIELDNQFKSLEREIKEKRSEIQSLEERRIELLRPLNDEHDKLTQREETIKAKETEFSQRFIKLKTSEKEVINKGKDLDLQMNLLVNRIKANDTETKKVKSNLIKAQYILDSANDRMENADRYVESKTAELRSREANLASREREIGILNDHITSREQEIIKKTILLEDREATLEREIKRQQKKWQQ